MKTFHEPVMVHLNVGPRALPDGVGLELELEGTALPIGREAIDRHGNRVWFLEGITNWIAHNENSLRNGGVEYVTNGTVPFDRVGVEVGDLLAYIHTSGGHINTKAHRGSTHIHLNVLHTPWIVVLGTMVVYTLVEPLLLRLCGPTRDGNHFCLPTYDSGDWGNAFSGFVRTIRRNAIRRFGLQRGKYAALNVDCLHTFGSLEFRMFPTSASPEEIAKWVGWVKAIRDVASEEADKTYASLLHNSLMEPELLVARIFGDTPEVRDVTPSTPADYIGYGAEQAHELVRVLVENYKQ